MKKVNHSRKNGNSALIAQHSIVCAALCALFFALCSLNGVKLARQRLIEDFLQNTLGRGSLDAVNLLAILEEDHRWDGHDP